MAALTLQVSTGEISIGTSAKTLLTLAAAANQILKIKRVEIFAKGTSTTDPAILFEIALISSDLRSASATAVNPIPLDGDDSEVLPIFYADYTSEPVSYGAVMRTWTVQPQYGLVVNFRRGDEIILAAGQELGFRVTANQPETMSLNVVIQL